MSIKMITVATAATLAFAAPAFADSSVTENDGKPGNSLTENNGSASGTVKWDRDTFNKNYDTTRFDRYDENGDGVISREEQMTYEFNSFDRDKDGYLNEEESAELDGTIKSVQPGDSN